MEKKIDAVFSGVTSPDAPGLAVLVRQNGKTLFEHGYGVTDLRKKTKIDAHANFRLASFTKQFTAMAILLLVRDGKLRYEETLVEIFPDFPDSGKSYGDFLPERIFAPLKMNHTVVYQKGKNQVMNRAFGHSKENDAFKETDQSPTSATPGDGGVYSNLKDLAKWDDALRNHTLLSEKEMQPALTPVRLNDGSEPHWPRESNDDNLHPGKPVSYGFGWFLDPYKGHRRMWHTGSTMGFRTVIERFLGENLTIVILCNRTDLDPERLSLQVADMLLPEKN